jgi:hypothetical protein
MTGCTYWATYPNLPLILITEVLVQETPGEIRAQIEDSYSTEGAECASADWVMQGLYAGQ